MNLGKLTVVIASVLLIENVSRASVDDISIKIESLTNISQNGALEACGTAIHKSGIKPVLITLKHDESFYTTLTAPNDKWCVVFKRWTFSGKVEVSGTVLGSNQSSGAVEMEMK